ncbi:hypothetical protein MKY59_25800 [Paenibacillus sp. FSL W8-0426]|uniref:hypothetical protein n=1 Tax=Paenibacillus sp. FSL W8-0426 TaxID=2921714 RepID=UPI0030DBAA8D
MKVTVYQQVYVCADKSKALVILVGEDGGVLDRHYFTYEAYPLVKIAWETFEGVARVLRRCFNADTIDYHCNILGHYHLTKNERGYVRKLIENRLIGKKSETKVTWTDPIEDNNEEDAA